MNPPLALPANIAAVASDTYDDPFAADTVRLVPLIANALDGPVPMLPFVDAITTVGAVTVTPLPVVNVVVEALVASAKYVPLALFGLTTVGQQFNNVGVTIATFPVDVSSTYTDPLAAVAEKLVAEKVIGDVTDVPMVPAVESNTNRFAFVIAATDDVIDPVDINAADPLLALIDAFANDIPAFVPDACRIMLLALNVELTPNDIVLPVDPRLVVSLMKYVPLVVLAAFCVPSAAATNVAACESVM